VIALVRRLASAKTFKTIIKACSFASSVELSGKKLSADAVSLLAKKRGAPLATLKISKVKAVEATLLDVIAASPQLKTLHADINVSDEWAYQAGERASAARGGGRSLLCDLSVGASWSVRIPVEPFQRRISHSCQWAAGMSVFSFGRLGSAFPELAKLHVCCISDMYRAAAGLPAFAPMPRLRQAHLKSLAPYFGAAGVSSLQSAIVQLFFRRLTEAAPALTDLRIVRGHDNLPSAAVQAGAQRASLPSLGIGLAGIGTLAHLTSLSLSQLAFTQADVVACDLPALRSLHVDMCGPGAFAAAAALVGVAPQLRVLRVSAAHPMAGAALLVDETSLAVMPPSSSLQTVGISASHAIVAASLRALGLAAPGLLSLKVAIISGSPPAPSKAASTPWSAKAASAAAPAAQPLFDAARPWPELRELSIGQASSALLAPLRAPKLASLELQGVVRPDGTFSATLGHSATAIEARAAMAAYDGVRRTSPHLPALREAAAPPAPPAAAAAAGPADEEEEEEGRRGGGAGAMDDSD